MSTDNRLLLAAGLLGLAVMLAVMAPGCGTSTPTVAGTVSVGTQPVQNGSITFFPIEGTPGGTSGATINEGKFEVSVGLTEGSYTVAIEGTRPDPNEWVKLDYSDELIAKPVQVVPEAYRGQDSPLIKTVETGHQFFSFELPDISVNKRSR